MKALFNAIYAAFDGSGIKPLVTGFWNTEAPDDAAFPYIVFQLVNDKTDDFASDKHFSENILLQFNLFDRDPSMKALLAIYVALIDCYDFANLAVIGYTALSCVREGTLQTKVNKVWQINVTYRIKLRSV